MCSEISFAFLRLEVSKERELSRGKGTDAGNESAPPWANAHPRIKVHFSTMFSEELHMKMTYLTENLPKLSLQKIVQEATALYVAQKLNELGKP